MGPRSEERGRPPLVFSCSPSISASMGPRSEERGRLPRRVRPSPNPSRFNGAAFGRTRKGPVFCSLIRSPRSLQWGRVRKNAEGGFLHSFPIVCVKLQWGRVRKNAEGIRGALEFLDDALLQWGRVRKNAEGWDWDRRISGFQTASMGPRSEERGRLAVRVNFTVPAHASMGPRSEERGRGTPGSILLVSDDASMGPRSEERGRSVSGVSFTLTTWLQWGRVRKNAEG